MHSNPALQKKSETKVKRTQVTHNTSSSTEESHVMTLENKLRDKSPFQKIYSNVGLKLSDLIVHREKKACIQQPRNFDVGVPDGEELNLAGTREDRAQGIVCTDTNVQSSTIIASKKGPHSQDKLQHAAFNRDSITSTFSQSSRVRKAEKSLTYIYKNQEVYFQF